MVAVGKRVGSPLLEVGGWSLEAPLSGSWAWGLDVKTRLSPVSVLCSWGE